VVVTVSVLEPSGELVTVSELDDDDRSGELVELEGVVLADDAGVVGVDRAGAVGVDGAGDGEDCDPCRRPNGIAIDRPICTIESDRDVAVAPERRPWPFARPPRTTFVDVFVV